MSDQANKTFGLLGHNTEQGASAPTTRAMATFQREIPSPRYRYRPTSPRYRPTPRERAERYGELKQRDGEKCANCGLVPQPGFYLEIDHADGKAWTWTLATQRLLCKRCNSRNQKEAAKMAATSVRKSERDTWGDPEPETESEIRRTRFPVFKRACILAIQTADKIPVRKLDETKGFVAPHIPWVFAEFTISQEAKIASTTAHKWIKEISRPYNMNGPLEVEWLYPEKGPRYRILKLAPGYTEASPD